MNVQDNNAILTRQAGLALFVATVAYVWAQAPATPTRPTPAEKPISRTWEHLAFEHAGASIKGDPELAQQINRLGNEGWELVDVEMTSEAGTTRGKTFFFKRPKMR